MRLKTVTVHINFYVLFEYVFLKRKKRKKKTVLLGISAPPKNRENTEEKIPFYLVMALGGGGCNTLFSA